MQEAGKAVIGGVATLALLAIILLEAAGLDMAVILLAGKTHPYYAALGVIALTVALAFKGRVAFRQIYLPNS